MTEAAVQQRARAIRSLLRTGSVLGALGDSPLATAAVENFVASVLLCMSPRGAGGRPIDPKSVRLYQAAVCYEQPDGAVSYADLLRVRDELFGDDKSMSKKADSLADRYKNARDHAEQEAALAWIKTSDAAQKHIQRARAELETREREVSERERVVTQRERVVAERDADATQKLKTNQELLTEIRLARNLPLTPDTKEQRD